MPQGFGCFGSKRRGSCTRRKTRVTAMTTRPVRADHPAVLPRASASAQGHGLRPTGTPSATPDREHPGRSTAAALRWPGDLTAEAVERSFTALLGHSTRNPALAWHADLLREGVVNRLGTLVAAVAAEITERTAASSGFATREAVAHATERLLEIGDLMRAQPEEAREPLDYHWIVIGELVAVLAALTAPPDDLFPDPGTTLEW
jgi:hypothetical protein